MAYLDIESVDLVFGMSYLVFGMLYFAKGSSKCQSFVDFFHLHIREACVPGFEWISGKFPNGLWPPRPFFGKFHCDFFRKFITKITVSNAKKIAMKFFGSEMTPPPPLGLFPKKHPFWKRRSSLICKNIEPERFLKEISHEDYYWKFICPAWMGPSENVKSDLPVLTN